MERRIEMMCGPLIDWNGNGRIDPSDIGISLAIAEEEGMFDEDEEEQQDSFEEQMESGVRNHGRKRK